MMLRCCALEFIAISEYVAIRAIWRVRRGLAPWGRYPEGRDPASGLGRAERLRAAR